MTDYTGTGRREKSDYEEYIASYHGLQAPLTREQFNQKFQTPTPTQPQPENLEIIFRILNKQLNNARMLKYDNEREKENLQVQIEELNQIIQEQEKIILTLTQTLNHFNLEITS